ncbi:DUF2921 family protein [Quillaja saponaria]|uniref:RING-type E3 ubiquitin transferase n=1 Tax=Quillaja saponaria TaxID=32244 RepID=A0AAD7KZB0_QUISA|nr:DUF2921 family protein [Quillaja saponaria]
MAMESLTLLFLFKLFFSTFIAFSLNSVPTSSAPQFSYKDHCASIVPESTPSNLELKDFPFARLHTGYFISGGDRILNAVFSVSTRFGAFRNSFTLRTRNIYATDIPGLFQVVGILTFRGTTSFYHVSNSTYRSLRPLRPYHSASILSFRLDGFWSVSSRKLCMIGNSYGVSKQGNSLNLNVVFKLYNVSNSNTVTRLVSGALESLNSENDENYFKPISVLILPRINYQYTLVSEKACSSGTGSDVMPGLSISSLPRRSFCSIFSRTVLEFDLKYSSECNSAKNCSPFGGITGFRSLPYVVSLKEIDCSEVNRMVRVLVDFHNNTDLLFNPKSVFVGEGWWDEKKNQICIVVCRFLGTEESSGSVHVGDCSTRVTLRFPAVWSIRDRNSIVGQIWSNKTANDLGYFNRIMFLSSENRMERIPTGLKYEYSQLHKVKKLCTIKKPSIIWGKKYPNVYSNDMRFDMSVISSDHRSSGWVVAHSISAYKIGGNMYNISRNSSHQMLEIFAEGTYDAKTGSLCMVGCRNLGSKNEIPTTHSVDCEILVKFQFPPLDAKKKGGYIKGSIESLRENTDLLYFNQLDLSSAAYYSEEAKRTIWRMGVEIIMVLVSTTLACVFVGLQLYHLKRKPEVLPAISLVMLAILTVGYVIPLVLNFEALFKQNPNQKNVFVGGSNGWLEVNEITVRLIIMVAFLLQFRLLQLTWSARMADGNKKEFWVAEKKSLYVTLPLYAAGCLVALLSVLHQQHTFWEELKSYGGLVLDGFLLPQIILNLFRNSTEKALSCSFYFGTTFVRLLPHAYDLLRSQSYIRHNDGSYIYANPNADFYSTAWDIVIPLGGLLFAVIIYLQQRFGGHCIIPRKFEGSTVHEKVVTTLPEEPNS